jgi:hypothetical protein
MSTVGERYLVDKKGIRQGVLLDIEEYQHILEELEELECLRAYDAAKGTDEEIVDFEEVVTEIESQRP